VKLEAEDQGTPDKVKSIKVRIASEFDSDSKTVQGGYFDETLTINWFSGAVLGGLSAEITITDLNGNQRKESAHIDGIFDEFLEVLTKFYYEFADEDAYYELSGYPKLWQGPYGLCAACTCLGIAWYYGLESENFGSVKSRSGDDDVSNGMSGPEQEAYHRSIGTFETIDWDPAFDDIKAQLKDQGDPVHARFTDYYGDGSDDEGHAVTIIGYIDNPLGKYAIIQDSNVAVTSYPRLWSDLTKHLEGRYFIYVNDP
jgi:hypothetical protein